jgi:hypothetical protein
VRYQAAASVAHVPCKCNERDTTNQFLLRLEFDLGLWRLKDEPSIGEDSCPIGADAVGNSRAAPG